MLIFLWIKEDNKNDKFLYKQYCFVWVIYLGLFFTVLTNWWYIIINFFTYITVQKFGVVIMFLKTKNQKTIMFIKACI